MTQGYIPNQAIVKKAGIPRIEDAMGGLFSRGLSGAQDIISGLSNRADVNQLKSIQAAQSIIPNRNNVLDANDLFQSVSGRVSGQQARGLAQKENQLASQGLASKLSDKNKIVNRIASEEAKSIDSARLDLDRQGKEALTQFEKQLRDSNSFDDNEIQDALNSARKQIESKNKELVFGEAKKVTQFLDKTGGMNPIESASFKGNELTRAIGGQPSIQAQALPIAAKAAAIYQGGGAPLVRTAGQILSAPENLMKQVGYQPEKPGLLKYAGDYLQGVNQDVQESPQVQMLQNQNPIVAGGTGLTGESIPFMIAPEGALARNAAASTIKTLAKAGAPSIVKKIAGAAIKEGVQDAGLSALQTGSDLLSQVDSGALTKEQALSQLPSQLAINAAGDFVSAGALRGAGDLAGKALKGQIKLPEMPKTETVGGEGGANAATRTSSIRELLGEKPKTEKKAGISQYNQFISLSKQKIQELQKSDLPDKEAQIQVLQKQIYDANEQKRILLAEKLKIDQTSNTAEARKQLDEILNSQRSAPFQPNKSADSEFVNSSNTPQQPPSTPTGSLFDNQIPLKQDSTGKADVLDELLRYKSLTQNRTIGNGDSVTLTFASKEQKALYELGRPQKFSSTALGGQRTKTKSQLEERARIREALKNRLGVDDAELRNLIEQTRNSVAEQVEALKTKTSEIKLKETIPKKPIIPDAPKTQNPIIPDAQTGKAGGQPTGQIKNAQKDLKNQYSEVLNKETAISEKPVRDGLEELGFEIKSNAKGEKYAQLGNVKVALKDIPPPYSLNGLKSSLKEKIASAKAAKDIQTGKVSDIEGIRSEFLDDAQASKYLDELDGEALFQEKQFIDSIKNAKSKEELGKIYEDKPDLFTYDSKTAEPSKYMKEYEARQAQLENLTSKQPSPVQTPRNQAEDDMIAADPRSFAQTKEGLTGQEFQDVRRNLSIRPEESGYIPRAKESLKLKEEDSKIIDEAARVEATLKISETRAEKVKDRLKKVMAEGETLEVQVPKGEEGVLSPLAGKEVTITIYGKNLKVYSEEAKELLDKLQKEQAEFKEKNPDLFTSKGTSEAEDVLSIQTENLDTRIDFDYTTKDKQKLGLEFLRNDLQYKISLAESKVLRNKISNDILTADRLRDLVSDTDRTAIFQRKKGGETRQLKEELTPEEQARAEKFEGIQKKIKEVEDNPASQRNKELRSKLNEGIFNSDKLLSQILDVAKGKSKNKLPEGTEAGQKLIKENFEKRGLTFGFNPFAGILGAKGIGELVSFMNNPSFFVDGVIGSIGLKRGWSEILPKFAGNNKKLSAFTQQAGDLADSMIGTQRFIREQFQLSKNPRVKEFIGQYEALNGKLALARTAINTLFTKEDVSKIREIFNEFSTSEITRMLKDGDIEGVADVDLLEIIRSLNKVKKQKQDLIKNYQKEFTGRDFNNLKALLAMESPEIANNPFIDGANKLALKVALFNRVSSTLLTLTDPILKNSLLQNGNPARIVEGYLRAVTDRNSKLFKAFEAGKTGTYLDDTSGFKIGNVDFFKFGTEYAQDVTLFAQAKKFEADWFKQTKEKIDIVKNFDVMTPEGAEFAMRWNKISQMAFGVGEGYLDKMNIQSSTALKGFLSLQSENMRFQGMLNRAIRNKDYSSIIGYLGYGTLIGGTGFLTGTGPIGFLLKTALNQFEPEQREKIIDTIDQLNFANKLLKLQIGDKLRLGTLNFRDEESLVKTIETAFKQDDEGKLFLVEVAKRFPRSLEKGLKQISNGNTLDGAVTIAKATPYISGLGTLADVLSKVKTGEPLKVWTRENDKLEEYFKSPEWQDALGTTLGAKNIKRASKLKDELAESVSGQEIIKVGKKYKLKEPDPKAKTRIEGLLNVLEEDRYQIPNVHYSRNEIMDDVLESAYKKKARQEKQKGEYSNPLTEEYVQARTAKELIRVYSVMKPEDRLKAKKLIQSASSKSKNRTKYREVLARLTVN